MADVKALRRAAGLLTQAQAATAYGVHERTWQRWESSGKPPEHVLQDLKTRARGIATTAVRVPILGDVPAGLPFLAFEKAEGFIDATPRFDREPLFAYRVRDESMARSGVRAGDVVVCRESGDADPEDLVVAAIFDGGPAVRRLRFRAGRPELHDDEGNETPAEHFEIVGKVLEVRRILVG